MESMSVKKWKLKEIQINYEINKQTSSVLPDGWGTKSLLLPKFLVIFGISILKGIGLMKLT